MHFHQIHTRSMKPFMSGPYVVGASFRNKRLCESWLRLGKSVTLGFSLYLSLDEAIQCLHRSIFSSVYSFFLRKFDLSQSLA